MPQKDKYIFMILVVMGLFLIVSSTSATHVQPETKSPQNVSGLFGEFIYLPITTNNFDASLGLPVFGTQMYGASSPSSPYHDVLLESNTTWLRTRVNWNSIEPVKTEPPTYNWSVADSTLAAAREDMGGFELIVTLETAPDWAAEEPQKPLYENHVDDYVQFVQALVERYDGDGIDDAPTSPIITYWEIYNEPDRNEWWGYAGDDFADLLKEVYPAVKAANPNAKVVFPGIAYDFFEDQNGPFVRSFFPDVLANGAKDYFDVMNFHSYPAFYPNWTQNQGPGLYEKAAAIRSIMNTYNVQKPIIVTEAGWYSNDVGGGDDDIPGSPESQTRYVVELFTQSMAADIDVMIWWLLYDLGHFESGLVTNDSPPTKKAAFTTFQATIDELSTAHFVRKLNDSESGDMKMEVYQFEDFVYQRDVYVAWMNPVNTTVTKPLSISASQATIRDSITGNVLGNVSDGEDGHVDGRITVTVGASPIYVEVGK